MAKEAANSVGDATVRTIEYMGSTATEAKKTIEEIIQTKELAAKKAILLVEQRVAKEILTESMAAAEKVQIELTLAQEILEIRKNILEETRILKGKEVKEYQDAANKMIEAENRVLEATNAVLNVAKEVASKQKQAVESTTEIIKEQNDEIEETGTTWNVAANTISIAANRISGSISNLTDSLDSLTQAHSDALSKLLDQKALEIYFARYGGFLEKGFKTHAAMIDALIWKEEKLFGIRTKLAQDYSESLDALSPTITTQFMGEGSSTLPLSEKIKEMTLKAQRFYDLIDNTLVTVKVDYSQATGALAVLAALGKKPGVIGTSRVLSAGEAKARGLPSYQHGTGMGGLPTSGWFYGHKGEIVKSPQESNVERQGENNYNITFAPVVMTGDRAAMRQAAIYFRDELKQLDHRWN